MSGISYEVLYMRMLELQFGNIFGITAAILSTFLLGIAIGSVFAHKFHSKLSWLQIGTGLYAALFSPILAEAGETGMGELMLNHDIISIIILLAIPTFFIGTSVPLFSGYLKRLAGPERSFHRIYSIYNFGAFFSILLIEFVLLRQFQLNTSVYLVSSLNIFCGIALLAFFRDIAAKPEEKSKEKAGRIDKTSLVIAGSSIFSSTFQMFFASVCFLVLTPKHENFSLSIAISLLAVSLSPYLVEKFKLTLSRTLVLLPLALGLIYLPLPLILTNIDTIIMDFGLDNFLTSFIFAAIFGLLPLLFYSATIPAVVNEKHAIEIESGNYLFWCCAGNTIGYLFYALVLHPNISINAYLSLIAAVSIFLAWIHKKGEHSPVFKRLAFIGIIISIAFPFAWDENRLFASPIFRYLNPESYDELKTHKSGTDSVTVYSKGTEHYLVYNGHLSINFRGEKTKSNEAETMLGVITGSFSRKNDKVLVLGIGTGITCGALALQFDYCDFVEINKAFAWFYDNFPEVTRHTFNNKNVNIYYADGRTFTQRQKKNKYDLIVNNVSQPVFFGACKLFTKEYIALAKKKLNPGGVFATWISSSMGSRGMKGLIKALFKNFKYCALTQSSGSSYVLAASDEPLNFNLPRVFKDNPKISKDLEFWGSPFSVETFIDSKLLSLNIFTTKAKELTKNWEANQDYWPVIEFAPRDQQDVLLLKMDKFNWKLITDPRTKELISLDIFRCRFLDYSRHFPLGMTYLFMQAKSKTIQYLETLPEWFAEQVVKRELSPTDYLMALATLYNQTGMHSLEYKTIKFLCDLQPDYLPAIKREKSLSETLKLQKEAKN
jgi:spermidine synthase